jgi:hypothetical protein
MGYRLQKLSRCRRPRVTGQGQGWILQLDWLLADLGALFRRESHRLVQQEAARPDFTRCTHSD